jgi:PadR family transcriptional regulator PadR
MSVSARAICLYPGRTSRSLLLLGLLLVLGSGCASRRSPVTMPIAPSPNDWLAVAGLPPGSVIRVELAADLRFLTYIEAQGIKLLRMDMGKDLVAASATPLVLAILAEGDSYGYAILKRVAELSGGHLQWTDGMLYPVLHRLERQGHVAAKWSASENGRKRKYYRITREGRAQLAAHRQQWQVVDGTLRGIWMKACTA